MRIRPIKSGDLKKYLEESRGLERDYMAEVLKSRLIAWCLAIGASALAAVALLALLFLIPLKTTIPYVVRVDNATGHIELVTTLRTSESTYGEVVDSYFLNQYVLNREGYDYNTLQNAYNTTALLSDAEVQREYYALFEGAQARDTVLKDRAKIIVQVRSITPTPEKGTAVVRFSTQLKQNNGSIEPLRNWIATMSYVYKDATMSSVDRRINPLGFQITSYRVDPETLTPSTLTSPTSP